MFYEGPKRCIPRATTSSSSLASASRASRASEPFSQLVLSHCKVLLPEQPRASKHDSDVLWLLGSIKPSDRNQKPWMIPFQHAKSDQTCEFSEIQVRHVFPIQALPPSAGTPALHRFKPLSCPGPPQAHYLPQRGQKVAGAGCLHEPPGRSPRFMGNG